MGLESCSQGTECTAAVDKPSKTPSNITEIVSKFAKVCKLRSIGVFPSENQCLNGPQNATMSEESSSNATTEEAECDGVKVHPQPIGVQNDRHECGHLEISNLFDKVSGLKLAYVKLQEAHIPYDPDKIRAADELVFSYLESLCKIKRVYKEKQSKEVNALSACSALLLAEIQVQERLLEKLKAQVKVKEAEVANLLQELKDLESNCNKLAQDFSAQEKQQRIKILKFLPFEDIVKAVAKAIHDFAKPLIALMKVSGWDLDCAANCIQDSVIYAKRSHKKYAFEAYIARRMFHEFSFQSYNVDNLLNQDDPINALIEDPKSSFAKFCRRKYLLVVHPRMEASFFGNVDHRMFVTHGLHPQTPFYRAFVKMARWVWILQGAAASFGHQPKMFTVERGSDFSDAYMECIEELKEHHFRLNQGAGRIKVEFMILPGFEVGDTLIKSRVYLSEVGISNPTS
ncbi:hypothetical protein M9H77_01029 [Catharanthus roseus]|uniref:Uncharacterized protein n=1 Tax=Catharanthus roseus TaxID=4058 RepID=A0ACC0C4K5_CATRO|nr:hypothetical protein M9H77_01029 [Catharanthus roseus]